MGLEVRVRINSTSRVSAEQEAVKLSLQTAAL